jgi:hypothetical protein
MKRMEPRKMKHKPHLRNLTLLCVTIGLVMGGRARSSAQSNVYSLNVVGYYNVLLTPGWNLIAVQLGATNYNANTVLPYAPDGSLLYRFNPTTQSYYDAGTYLAGVGWYPLSGNTNDPVLNLPLGEGFFVWTPQSWTATFVGEVPQGSLNTPLPANYSIKASMVPQAGLLTSDLGFPALDTDQAWRWLSPAFLPYYYDGIDLAWYPTEPSLNVGEGFFLKTAIPRTWTRNFTVQFAPSLPNSPEASPGQAAAPGQPAVISLSVQGGNAVLKVNVSGGNSYAVQFASSPYGGFTDVATGQMGPTWQEPLRGPKGYYRIRLN